MNDLTLPPKVSEIINGSVEWSRIEKIDYESLGYFLSCHLVIEHYLDEYLKIEHPALDWDSARQTFGQKVSLLSKFKISDKYDCIPAIKHMNSIRNKLSHRIDFSVQKEDLLPLIQYLEKTSDGQLETPITIKEILGRFTSMVCVLFAGYISSKAHYGKVDRR
ncbi:hypothetical protein [Microbulbifer mangrovi]|uniref:hypothetical protein n=1 Tax=Microbulbifer mangrovi TaxID=927787 RepID=UPI0009903875|nr:hypothetical protein [Microbulbifer mangrovi]